jgi:hypothetical protein
VILLSMPINPRSIHQVTWRTVEKMLQDDQATWAPRAVRVSCRNRSQTCRAEYGITNDEDGGLNGHVEAAGDASALERLRTSLSAFRPDSSMGSLAQGRTSCECS